MKEIIKKCKIVLLVLFGFLVQVTKAQNITNSIYSRYGYGTEVFKGFATNIALGGTGVAQKGPFNLNYFNPASNAALKLTAFNAGINGNYMQQSNTTDTIVNKSGSFGYLAVGFPVTKWWGLSFGLIPYTGVGYKVADTTTFGKREIVNTYKGSGGLNKLYIANGFNPFKIFNDSLMQGFAIGINSEFTFGNIMNEEYKSFIGSDTSYYLNILNNKYSQFRGFSFLVGLQHTLNIKDETKITLGFSYGFKSRLNIQESINSERYFNTNLASSLVDTAYYSESDRVTGYLPSQFTFGFNLQMGPKVNYSMEFRSVKWGSDSISGKQNNLKDSRTISAGFQYFPNSQSPDGFLKHTFYRFGFKNSTLPFYLNDEQILENAITLGAGFPLRKAVSTVNIGMELGRRGTTLNNLVKENYFLVNIGFTINDRWFIKTKYD
jgi:hypothetical protein